jgi:hypothetical protein
MLVVFLMMAGNIYAQTDRMLGISVYTNYSNPIAGLSGWFKPAINLGIGVGGASDQEWYMEGLAEYSLFDKENLNSYAGDKVALSLEHFGLIFNTKYSLFDPDIIDPYLNFGVGLYYWKGSRGEIQPDDQVDPPIPYIEERVLEEWNWGFRAGIGSEIFILENFSADVVFYYRLIIGDLWPTLQPRVELEGVSGFQTLNLDLHLRYYIN